MPFFGPSFAGRSNKTTGTLTLTRCAAICAPITPAPSTATFFTWKRLIVVVPSLLAAPAARSSWSLYMAIGVGSGQRGVGVQQHLGAGARGAHQRRGFGEQLG